MSQRAVALLGYMGSGKSTVGARLAQSLGLDFIDLDVAFAKRHGAPAAWIERHGEADFRLRESEILRAQPTSGFVLATGGGTPVAPENRVFLERWFDTLWLDVPHAVARARCADGTHRPLLGPPSHHQERADVYRSSRERVDATGPVQEVLERVLQALDSPRRVRLESGPTDVIIEADHRGLARMLGPGGVVVTDDRVGPLYLDRLAPLSPSGSVTFANGESNKTLDTWSDVVSGLLEAGLRRDGRVLALGGGVVGDVAGFAASTVNRGVEWVQLPTTTLAMVDSSVGGKTGVNHALGKNLVGTFHSPIAVWIALDTLGTLDRREHLAGMAEVVKVALVADAHMFGFLEAGSTQLEEPTILAHIIHQAIRAKARIVDADPHEASVRRVLNAGHTVGHGLERVLGYGTLLHGEAVAIGLVAELRWAESSGLSEPGLTARVSRLFQAIGLPVAPPDGIDGDELLAALQLDKKGSQDRMNLPVPTSPGVCRQIPIARSRLTELVRAALQAG